MDEEKTKSEPSNINEKSVKPDPILQNRNECNPPASAMLQGEACPDGEQILPSPEGTPSLSEASDSSEASENPPAPPPSPHKGFWGKVDRYFGITASGSDFKKEIVAGLTTFMAMIYIYMVTAGMFQSTGLSYGAAYIATAIGAVAGTMIMAFVAKMPLAQASGMGITAFIVHNLLLKGTGLTYANCMVFTLIDGVVFLILTVTGLRKKIFEAIPKAVRHAIPVGIGLFIAFIGMQNAGVIVNDPSTLVSFASFNVLPGGASFLTLEGDAFVGILPALVAILGVIAIAVMSKKNWKGAILWGILGCTALYYAGAGIGYACGSEGCKLLFQGFTVPENPLTAFKDWGMQSAGKVFTEGFNFGPYLKENGAWSLALLIFTSALSLCMLDMFDTIGTLYGACARGKLLDENGMPIRMDRMMLSNALAATVGAVAGISTVTTCAESSSGVVAGGKTGFTAFVTGVLFFLAMFLSPVAQLIPSCATGAALMWVGVLMMNSVKEIDWDNPCDALVAFLTFVVMVLGYSISKGIGIGILAYIVVTLCSGKAKEITLPTWIIGILFLAMFLLT